MQAEGRNYDASSSVFLASVSTFFSVLGSVCIFLVTLYLFDDWVLLLLFSTLILLGLWSSRNAIAKFWNQITLLLNIGPIREGEVVVINSIPWRIERVNF